MFEQELTVVVLDNSENNLGFLHPKYVDVTETNTLEGLRSIKITHPLTDDNNEDLTRYNNLLVHGNKVWREKTSDGDSCLYVMLEDKEVDQLANTVSITAEEVANELSMLPPVAFSPVIVDNFDGMVVDTTKWVLDIPSGTSGTITESGGRLRIYNPGGAATTAFNIQDGQDPLAGLLLPSGDFDFIAYGLKYGTGIALVDNLTTRANGCTYTLVTDYELGQNNSMVAFRGLQYSPTASGEWNDKDAKLSDMTSPVCLRVQRIGTQYIFSYGTSPTNFNVTRTVTLPFTPNYIALYTNLYNLTGNTVGGTGTFDAATLVTPALTNITINSTLLESLCGDLFEMGTITPQIINYNGDLDVLPFLREVESQTGYEFQFRYEYDTSLKKIRRYLDFVEQRGKTHTQPVEIGYNTNNIEYEDTETDTFLGAGPTGAPSDDTTTNIAKFHKARQLFIDLEVDPEVQIPLWVTTDSSGNETTGPLAYPPFAKVKGESFVRCLNSDSAATYKEVQKMQGGGVLCARICTFNSTEENKYNLYWNCVEKINEKNQPNISLSTNVIDIPKIKGNTPEYYNVGDSLPIQLPGRTERVQARVTKTVKNPRNIDKDQITIGNYSLNFFADYVNAYIPAKKPYL